MLYSYNRLFLSYVKSGKSITVLRVSSKLVTSIENQLTCHLGGNLTMLDYRQCASSILIRLAMNCGHDNELQ